jgi:rhomboid protease GluP
VAAQVRFGFSGPLFDQILVRREADLGDLVRLVSYGAIHASAYHTLFAVVLLLALGKAVGERLAPAAMAAVLVAGTVAGALAYWAAVEGRVLLVGAYPAIYGLIGAFTWDLWRRAEGPRGRLLAFRLVGVLIALQLALRLFVDTGEIWAAELGGFLAGFVLAAVLAPGGGARLRRVRERLRAR